MSSSIADDAGFTAEQRSSVSCGGGGDSGLRPRPGRRGRRLGEYRAELRGDDRPRIERGAGVRVRGRSPVGGCRRRGRVGGQPGRRVGHAYKCDHAAGRTIDRTRLDPDRARGRRGIRLGGRGTRGLRVTDRSLRQRRLGDVRRSCATVECGHDRGGRRLRVVRLRHRKRRSHHRVRDGVGLRWSAPPGWRSGRVPSGWPTGGRTPWSG